MKPKSSQHFSTALRGALVELDMTQQQFSEQVGISVALLTKIFRGEPVHRKSLRLVLGFFHKVADLAQNKKMREMAAKLINAYQRDMLAELGVNDDELESLGVQPDLLSKRDRAVLTLFRPISRTTILALHCLGTAAEKDETLRDSLFAQADLANSLRKRQFPAFFFRECIKVPPPAKAAAEGRSFRGPGGFPGDIASALWDE